MAPRVRPLDPKNLPVIEQQAWNNVKMMARDPGMMHRAGYSSVGDYVLRRSQEIEQGLQAWEVANR